MDIKTFKNLATKLPPEIAVLMRGPTGVGKSQLASAAAKELGLPFIDVRGSTMDESKVTGIPDFEVSKESGVATFVLPSWFVRGCGEPVVMMLDELNRDVISMTVVRGEGHSRPLLPAPPLGPHGEREAWAASLAVLEGRRLAGGAS